MIPKIIHYCWFGNNPLPKKTKKYIKTWRKYFPDYEIKLWNEENFDVNIIPYTRDAYAKKKYAFVSDFARFYVLYKYGGLYFDTDVEVIADMSDIIEKGDFMALEHEEGGNLFYVAPGLVIGTKAFNPFLKSLLNIYEKMTFDFKSKDMPTVVTITTHLLEDKGFICENRLQSIEGITIYPTEYFCPINRFNGTLLLTQNTKSIHHYDGTWMDGKGRLRTWLMLHNGNKLLKTYSYIKNKLLKIK